MEILQVYEPLFNGSISLDNSSLYNTMIFPFTRMVIYGIIWYQGKKTSTKFLNENKMMIVFIQMKQMLVFIETHIVVHFQS